MSKQSSEIISSVPGMELPQVQEQGMYHGQVVPIEDFQGDPSRVLGHPSNPSTVLFERAGEAVAEATVPAVAHELGAAALSGEPHIPTER